MWLFVLNISFNASASGAMMQCSNRELDYVYHLDLNMDLGALHCGARSESRYKQINSWFRKDPWLDDVLFKVRDLKRNGNAVDYVKKQIEDGEKIRIWYDYSPSAMCGFYYLVSELYWDLYYRNEEIAVVCMNDDPAFCAGWRGLGGLNPNQFSELLQYEKRLNTENQRTILQEWSKVAEQQWPIRTVLNGNIVGVPEDFYDPLIKAFIPKEDELIPIKLLGNILALPAIPDFSFAEWRLAVILRGMKLKKRKVGPEKYDRRRAKYENYVFSFSKR